MTFTFTPDPVVKLAAKVFTPDEVICHWEAARNRGDAHQAVFYLNVLALFAPVEVPSGRAMSVALAAIHRGRGEVLSAMQYEEKEWEVDVGEDTRHQA